MDAYYDIIIIGSGPAGANLARLIDSEKHSVLIIDGSEVKPKVCGGLISPDAQDLLARYDISIPSYVTVSPQLFSVRTLDLDSGLVRLYRRSYLNVDRAAFDRYMLDKVPDAVECVSGVCTAAERTDDGYAVTLSDGRILRCGYIVGADGADSVVRRCLFKDKKIKRYTAIQQWYRADETVNPFYSCVFDSETSECCSWIFFKNGELVFGGAFNSKSCKDAFGKQKEKLVSKGLIPEEAAAAPLRTEACMVSRPKFLRGIFRGEGNAFLIGEAAGMISPSSFEGISYALACGEALAEAFSEDNVIKAYKRNTNRLCLKIWLKCIKRPFMYEKHLRCAVMRSGLSSIKKFKPERKKTKGK